MQKQPDFDPVLQKPPTPAFPVPTVSLSKTERRVCAYLLQALTERRVAELMQRSPNTIHVHVRNIYRKLGVSSRRELSTYPGIIRLVLGETIERRN